MFKCSSAMSDKYILLLLEVDVAGYDILAPMLMPRLVGVPTASYA